MRDNATATCAQRKALEVLTEAKTEANDNGEKENSTKEQGLTDEGEANGNDGEEREISRSSTRRKDSPSRRILLRLLLLLL